MGWGLGKLGKIGKLGGKSGGDVASRITISGTSVSESSPVGTLVGILGVASANGTPSFSLVDDAGGQFAIDGNRLEVADVLTGGIQQIVLAATGVSPLPPNRTVDITVTESGAAGVTFFPPRYFAPRYFPTRYFG